LLIGPDEGLRRIEEVAEKDWPRLSETDTRVKIIDAVFKECLGWSEEDITREEHADNGFVDYVFHPGGNRIFVLEAKNNGSSFEVPLNLDLRNYKINGSIKTEKDLEKAMEQAHEYCADTGIRFAVVSNGSQYVIFEGLRLYAPWKDGKCAVFTSFKDIVENFNLFWNILSKPSVLEGSLKKYLIEKPELKKFTRPSELIHVGDSSQPRNDLYNRYLQPFAEYFLADITDEGKIDLLRECYVPQKSHSIAEDSLRPYFLERIKYLRERFHVQPFVESEKEAGRFGDAVELAEKYIEEHTPPGRFILLMGGVGAGKTTFLYHFFRVVLEDRERLIWLYVDSGKAPIDADKVEGYVFSELISDFYRKYSEALKAVIQKNDLTSLQATYKDVVNLVAVLGMNGFSPVIVIDNIDQQQVVSDRWQEQTILEAERLSKALRAVVILSLREQTFFRSSLRGVLDAYTVQRFNVPPPPFHLVVERRLDKLIELLESNPGELARMTGIEAPSQGDRIRLANFLKIVRESVGYRGPAHKAISNFITSVSKGNMRVGLECLNGFLSSGNTKVDEMLNGYMNTGSYTIPYWAFLKSVSLGDRRYYSGDASRVMNLFELNTNYTDSHFLNLRILKYINDRWTVETEFGRGFVDVDSIKIEAEKVGCSLLAINYSLSKLSQFKLIETENGEIAPGEANFVKATPTGDYYLHELVKRFSYLDLVWQDTPIADLELVRMLRNGINSTDVEYRLERVELFLDYLAKQEILEFSNNSEYADSALMGTIFMDDIRTGFEKDKKYIVSRRTRTEDAEFFDDKQLSEKSYWE
jgi:hypothetical protein